MMASTNVNGNMRAPTAGAVPNPDPTLLTTEMQEKATVNLKELMEVKHENQQRAIERLQKEIDERPNIIAAELVHLRELIFSKVGTLTEVVSVRFEAVKEQFANGEKNLSLALTSAEKLVQEKNLSSEKAISKSEVATADSVKAIEAIFNTNIGGLRTEINALTSRLDRGEGQKQGAVDLRGYIFGAAGFIAALATAIGAIVVLIK